MRISRAACVLATCVCAWSCQEKTVTTVTGRAGNAKMGAAIVCDDGVYYVDGLVEWPAELDGTTIRATGTLEVVRHPEQNPELPSTAMEGDQLILKDARWQPANR